MMTASHLNLLLEVQELDKEIVELNSQLSKYPGIWEETKKNVVAKKTAIETAKEDYDKHHKERRRAEQKLRLFSDDLRRFQAQANLLKTAKEYEAINKQIEGTKQKMSQVEEQALALIGEDETMEKSVGVAEKVSSDFEAFAKKEKERIREQFAEKKARIAELEAEKKKLMKHVTPEIGAVYDRVMKRHPGSAVVTVRAGSCSGCHFSLLPNVLVNLHRGEKAVICPNCDRLLARDEDYNPSANEASA